MWSAIEGDLKADVSALPKFKMVHPVIWCPQLSGVGAFSGDNGDRRWSVFKDRITEYNIRTIGMLEYNPHRICS